MNWLASCESPLGEEGGEILARIEKSIEIRKPPEEIWPMGSFDKLPEWFGMIKKAEWTSKDKDKLGATVHVTVEVAGIKGESDMEITEWAKNEKRAWRTTAGNMTAIGSATLTPTKAGTKITFVMDYDMPYSILGKIIDKLHVSKEMDKSIEKSLKNLKETLEK
jgi:uncharacterized membrane protein